MISNCSECGNFPEGDECTCTCPHEEVEYQETVVNNVFEYWNKTNLRYERDEDFYRYIDRNYPYCSRCEHSFTHDEWEEFKYESENSIRRT